MSCPQDRSTFYLSTYLLICFSQGFSHFSPIALAFLPIHECPCLQVLPL